MMIKFNPIELSDKKIFQEKLLLIKQPNCELSFQNIFMWGEFYDYKWTLFNDTILLYDKVDNIITLIGNQSLNNIANVAEYLSEINFNGKYANIAKNIINEKTTPNKSFLISTDKNYFDYIYSIEKLINLSGKKLRKKQNLINQFKKQYPLYECVELSSLNIEIIKPILTKWYEKHNNENTAIESKAINKGMKYFSELDLEGLVILVENIPIAFTIFSRLDKETYLVHFEKALLEVKGLYQIINFETAKFLKDKAIYINREQDLGIETLRKSKKSYDPDFLLETLEVNIRNYS